MKQLILLLYLGLRLCPLSQLQKSKPSTAMPSISIQMDAALHNALSANKHAKMKDINAMTRYLLNNVQFAGPGKIVFKKKQENMIFSLVAEIQKNFLIMHFDG
jgi:hypothetical protein